MSNLPAKPDDIDLRFGPAEMASVLCLVCDAESPWVRVPEHEGEIHEWFHADHLHGAGPGKAKGIIRSLVMTAIR